MKNSHTVLHSILSATIILAFILSARVPIEAGRTHLDYSFHNDGKTVTSYFGQSIDVANAVAIQVDTKVVVAGRTDNEGGDDDFCLMRYTATGGLDPVFGAVGKVRTDFGGDDVARAVVIQNDGKIVVAGSINHPAVANDFAVARYNTDGSLDTSFSGDGKLLIDFQGNSDIGHSVALQFDGKILVAGSVDSALAWGVARINVNGTMDATFGGGDGKVITDVGAGTEIAYGVHYLPNGKIAAGGVTSRIGASDSDFAIVRYNSDGTLDTTFDSDGKVISDFNGLSSIAYAFKPAGSGFVLAGESHNASLTSTYITVARYTSEGALVTSFGGTGWVHTDLNPANVETAFDVVVNSLGEITVAGRVLSSGAVTEHFVLLRYRTTGDRDLKFGTNGRVNTVFGIGTARANAIAIRTSQFEPDDVVAVGTYSAPGQGGDFAVARYDIRGPANRSQFYADGEGDFAVFRPADGNWYMLNIETGFNRAVRWGQSGDIPVPCDYEALGETDAAVFRNGVWYIRPNAGSPTTTSFGLPGDKPVQGDYDGDGKCDIAVYRPSNGVWHLLRSDLGYTSLAFGLSEDKPSQGDFDGDGLTDVAVFRPSTGTWYIQRSTLGFYAAQFGASGDRPVPADYDGDGRDDIAVFRPSTGVWYTINSQTGTNLIAQFGISTDIPGPADFDGDGKADLTVFRPSTGVWYSLKTTNGSAIIWPFGSNGDIPISASYTPQ